MLTISIGKFILYAVLAFGIGYGVGTGFWWKFLNGGVDMAGH